MGLEYGMASNFFLSDKCILNFIFRFCDMGNIDNKYRENPRGHFQLIVCFKKKETMEIAPQYRFRAH